jgi:hypothetical protein
MPATGQVFVDPPPEGLLSEFPLGSLVGSLVGSHLTFKPASQLEPCDHHSNPSTCMAGVCSTHLLMVVHVFWRVPFKGPLGFPLDFVWASPCQKAIGEEHAMMSAEIASADMHEEHA